MITGKISSGTLFWFSFLSFARCVGYIGNILRILCIYIKFVFDSSTKYCVNEMKQKQHFDTNTFKSFSVYQGRSSLYAKTQLRTHQKIS